MKKLLSILILVLILTRIENKDAELCKEEEGEYMFESRCTNCKEKSLKIFNHECVEKCPTDYYYTNEKGECISCSSKNLISCPSKEQCIDSCQLDGYILSEDSTQCLTCKEMNYFLYETSCVNECPSSKGYVEVDGVCTKCSDLNKKVYNKECVDTCPSKTIEVNGQCLTCKAAGYVIYGNNCVEKCPNYFTLDEATNVCVPCKEKGKYTYEAQCVDACPKGYTFETEGLNCMTCLDAGMVNYHGECYQECPEDTSYDIETNLCLKCKKEMYFNEITEECVNECDKTKYYQDEEGKICSVCKDSLLFDGKCYKSCDEVDMCQKKGENVCEYCNECQEKGLKLYQGKCVSSCPGATKESKGECLSCKSLNLFEENGECVSQCNENRIANTENVCVDCSLYLDGNCVVSCPNNYLVKEKKCEKCPNSSPYFYNGQCFNKCPERTQESYGNICVMKNQQEALGCGENGEFDTKLDKCVCNEGYSGNGCEIKNQSDLKVYVKMIDEDFVVFAIDGNKEEIGEIEWSFNNEKDYSISDFPNSYTQIEFKVGTNKLVSENTIKVKTSEKEHTFSYLVDIPDTSKYSCDIHYYEYGKKVLYGTSKLSLITVGIQSTEEKKYLYKFSYVDSSKKFTLPLTEFTTLTSYISDEFPVTEKLLITLKSSSGIKRSFNCDISVKKNENSNGSALNSLIKSKATFTKSEINEILSLIDNVEITNDIYVNLKKFLINNSNIDYSTFAKVYKVLIDHLPSQAVEMSEVLEKMIQGVSKNFDANTMSISDINAYISIIDQTYELITNISQEAYEDDIEKQSSHMTKVRSTLTVLTNLVAKKLSPGERVKLSSKNIVTYIGRPTSQTKKYTIPEEDDDDSSFYSNIGSSDDETEESECKNNELFCMGGKSMSKLSLFANTNNLRLLSETLSVEDISFSVSKLKLNMTQTQLSNASLFVQISNLDSLYIPDLEYTVSQSADISIPTDTACVDLTRISVPTQTCKTYFNYDTNRMICKCTGSADISNIMNYTLSSLSKVLQFPTPRVGMLNSLSLSIIYVSLSIIIIFSIILSIIDLWDDRNLIKMNDKTDCAIIKEELKSLGAFNGVNVFGFATFITIYNYPFFGVFMLYKFDQPRFLRFMIEILSILLNLIFTLFPYYNVDFEDKIRFINSRDIEAIDFSIDNLPCKIITMLQTIVYSIVSSVVITILLTIFLTLLQWNKFIEKVWRRKKKRIELYIRAYMVRPLLEGNTETKRKIRQRLLCWAVFQKELMELKEEKDTLKEKGEKKQEKNEKLVELIQVEDSKVRKDSSHSLNSTLNESEGKSLIKTANSNGFFISQENSFDLNTASEKGTKKKKVRLFYYLNQYKYLKVFFNFQKKEVKGGYTNYILRKASTDSFSVLSKKRNIISERSLKHDRCKLIKFLIIILATFALYSIVFYFFVFVAENVYKNYSFYIVKAWLLPCLLQLFVVGVLIEFGLDLFAGVMCYCFYRKRKKNLLMKLLFLLVSKDKMYMYKIRNYITKYFEQIKETNEKQEKIEC